MIAIRFCMPNYFVQPAFYLRSEKQISEFVSRGYYGYFDNDEERKTPFEKEDLYIEPIDDVYWENCLAVKTRRWNGLDVDGQPQSILALLKLDVKFIDYIKNFSWYFFKSLRYPTDIFEEEVINYVEEN